MARNTLQTRASVLATGLLAGVMLLPTVGPAMADYTRHCNAELVVAPQNASQTYVTYNFSVQKTVDLYAQVNQARRAARDRIISCVTDHFAEAEVEGLPRLCMNRDRAEFVNYPFTHLETELTEALCAANPGEDSLLVRADLYLTGDDGCVASGSREHREIAQNYQINCTAPIGDGGADEAVEDEPVIGDGGGWECVGEGCDGTATDDEAEAEEPETDAPPPPTAYIPLPNVRLPGNDLRRVDLPSWQQCRDACSLEAACGAWTYRTPSGQCLLKRRAGLPIPDGCCRSGIKR